MFVCKENMCVNKWIKTHLCWNRKIFSRRFLSRVKRGIKYTRLICYIAFLFFVIFVSKNVWYLIKEFALNKNVNVQICGTCSMKYMNEVLDTKQISNNIHQIFFTVKSNTLSDELRTARDSWLKQHKNFNHYLWNETSVIHFIRRYYPHLEPLYKSYNYWVRRVNVARYLILYHYGGWYVDLDMTCVRSLQELGEKAARLNKSVVQHYTFPVGTSNDFFGVTPRHQFLKSVLDHLPNSNRWFIFPYPNTVLTTGTTYMWGRYLNYPYQDEFMILEQDEIQKYVRHHHHSTWHGWDALLIRFFVKYYHVLALPIIFVFVYYLLWLLKSKRMIKRLYRSF